MSGISVLNFRSFFFSLDNENKMSAFQKLAISLSGSFCQKTAIPYTGCKTPSTRVLLQTTGERGAIGCLPRPAQRRAHTKKPPNHLPAHSAPAKNLLLESLTWGSRGTPSLALRRLISNARAADCKRGFDLTPLPQTNPRTNLAPRT